ncbi:hypothetical protein [Okeania sp. KiyG1]|uniref:hypothetical protein n=1 Tax=Okeania sp. KiyG1 TaxID=2720165 RepID=UPI0019210B87|nr:hypothetical protein [Okeania sp. KiyG1]
MVLHLRILGTPYAYQAPYGLKTITKSSLFNKKTKVFLNKLEEYMTVVKNL